MSNDSPSREGLSPEQRELLDLLLTKEVGPGGRPGEPPRSAESLSLINPGTALPPLFMVHGGGGEILFLHAFEWARRGDRRVYGLRAQGMAGKAPPLTRIEDMADLYLRQIRTVWPEGPFLLGGYCVGGIVAFEMAQRLHAEGKHVPFLLAMDTRRPPLRRTPGEKSTPGWGEGGKKPKTEHEERAFRINWRFMRAHGLGLDPFSPEAERIAPVDHGLETAREQYVARTYPGPIHLVWSTLNEPDDPGAGALERWSELAGGGLEVFSLETDHVEIVKPPWVGKVSTQIEEWIRKALKA